MSVSDMTSALQKHVLDVIKSNQEQIKDQIIKTLGTDSQNPSSGSDFRRAFGSTNQQGFLGQREVDQLYQDFNQLTEITRGTLRDADRLRLRLQGIVATDTGKDKDELLKSFAKDPNNAADTLLKIASNQRNNFKAIHSKVATIASKYNVKKNSELDVKVFDSLFSDFVGYLDTLNSEAVKLFNSPGLVEAFNEWLNSGQERALVAPVATAAPLMGGFAGMITTLSTGTAGKGRGSNERRTTAKSKKSAEEKEADAERNKYKEGDHGYVNRKFKEFIVKGTSPYTVAPDVADYISLNTDAGHILGLFNIRLLRLFGIQNKEIDIQYDQTTLIPKVKVKLNINSRLQGLEGKERKEQTKYLKKLSNLYTGIFQQLNNIDVLTSAFIDSNEGIQTSVSIIKQNFTAVGSQNITEPAETKATIQISWLNREAGNRLAYAGKKLTELIDELTNPNATPESLKKATSKFFGSFATLDRYVNRTINRITADSTIKKVDDAVLEAFRVNSGEMTQAILRSKGSDDVPTSLVKSIKALFENTTYNPNPTVLNNVKLKPVKSAVNRPKKKVVKTPVIQEASKAVQKAIAKATRSVNLQISRAQDQARKTKTGKSLANLQSILNGRLFDQIRKNMGTGNRRDVLNFQTGRFAESATIQRMSQSREGMITAFYTYMKNPYATFSRGGVQERPFTRDPKTLISKSIRELAAPLVANRMRAVLV